MYQSIPSSEIRRDETINDEVLAARQETKQALQNSLETIISMFPASEVMEELARAYQRQRDGYITDWYHKGSPREANKALSCDLISQKLIRVAREMEGK